MKQTYGKLPKGARISDINKRLSDKNKIMIKEIIQSVTDEPIEFIKNLSFLIGLTSTFYVFIWIFY